VQSTAKNSQTPASLDGLDDIYDVTLGTAEEITGSAKGTDCEKQEQPGAWVTVEEAAKRLGISANAIIKRLGKGKLLGKKVPGQFGEKWMVAEWELPQEIKIDFQETEQPEAQPGNSTGNSSKSKEQPGAAVGIAEKSLDLLGEVIRQQNEQLRVQNEVIRHLSEEVRTRDQQIKLLTDSQHKQGGWSRFWSWFTGS
jgi:hypothetical protein